MAEDKNKSGGMDGVKNYTPDTRPTHVEGNYIPTTNQDRKPAQNDRPSPTSE